MSGPALFGALFGYYFMGLYTLQLYRHISASLCLKERPSVHVVVVLTTLLEFLQLICVTHIIIDILIQHPGDPSVFQRLSLSSASLPALNGLVAFLVQSFRLRRIHSFVKQACGSTYVCPLTFLLCLCQCGAALGITAMLIHQRDDVQQLSWLKPASITWLSLSMASDALVTATIVLPLLEWKASSAFDRSRRILNSVILKAVESGSITVLFTIPYLVVYVKYHQSTLGTAFEFIVGRLYANVLLATLNAREKVRQLEFDGDLSTRRHLPWIMDGEALSLGPSSEEGDADGDARSVMGSGRPVGNPV
ncbi:hypothetical protein FA13DRAFT_1796125 [Coprinellus micaceus]|uniref:DUF6534 domain-containing protein n=1 Tax=Coprinellus micaceus TaxID=71717 RepID=A0A4Y7SVB5_COPMI|nr:hypothetical protein FA13DRAFT_1796125 [Coprinellus micaceus]